MTADDIRIALGAPDFKSLTIERLPAVGVSGDPEVARATARELSERPKYGVDGPGGERLVAHDEYLALRSAGALDRTPWES